MIPIFIPTKGRAPQVRLLLESLHRNAPGVFQPTIMVKSAFKGFQQPLEAGLQAWTENAAYEKLANEDFVKEMGTKWLDEMDVEIRYTEAGLGYTEFATHWYNFLESNWDRHVGFFMDDCILYRPIKLPFNDFSTLFDANTWCVSLRLGLNTVIHDYRAREKQKELDVKMVGGSGEEPFVYWKFRDHPYDKNYGFHFSWDGVFYRAQGLLDIANKTTFMETDNKHAIIPQRIENYFMNRRDMVQQDYMCAPKHSAVICMEWNSTHPYHTCGMNHGMSMKHLNNEYVENNMVIDLDSIDFSNVVSCHEEFPFKLRKL